MLITIFAYTGMYFVGNYLCISLQKQSFRKINLKKIYDKNVSMWAVILRQNIYSVHRILTQSQSFSERALILSERERRSNSHWWALKASAPKITERERKLALIFALKMKSHLQIFRKKIYSKT